jgi:hypothetical protein
LTPCDASRIHKEQVSLRERGSSPLLQISKAMMAFGFHPLGKNPSEAVITLLFGGHFVADEDSVGAPRGTCGKQGRPPSATAQNEGGCRH